MTTKLRVRLFFVTVVLTGCAEDLDMCREYYDNGKPAFEVPCREWDKAFHGEMKMFYPSGELKAIRTFVEGKEQDTARYFHEGGELKRLDPMVEGQTEGLSRVYRTNGTLAREIEYVEGQQHGEERIFYPSGKQVREIFTYQNGELFGPHAQFTEEGAPLVKGELYYGFRFAKWSNFRPNGSLANEFTYRHDRKSGPFAVYRENGIPYISGSFVDGKIDGELLYYNEDGAIVRKEKWITGLGPNGRVGVDGLIDLKALDGSKIVITKDFVEVSQ